MRLSILVPTIKRHDKFFTLLKFELYAQMLPYKDEIELLYDDSEEDSIGAKRNRLLDRATGEYLCFFDSDDRPEIFYIERMMKAVESGCDCASLKGLYSVNGVADGLFEHSIKYDRWKTNPEGYVIKYERGINHLNLVKTEIAKHFQFPEINHGEDHVWSTRLQESEVLRNEYHIPEVIYFYNKLT